MGTCKLIIVLGMGFGMLRHVRKATDPRLKSLAGNIIPFEILTYIVKKLNLWLTAPKGATPVN